MKFGALFLGDPPWSRVVDLAKKAEEYGFDYVWTADSHILWMEPWLQYALIARETKRIKIGPLVTNPGTRDWSVVGSLMATLNEISDGRAVCGIGRGDSARRTIGQKPVSIGEWEKAIPVIKAIAEGREVQMNGATVQIPWASGHECEMWGAAYGPRALGVVGRQCDGFILQLADPDVLQWCRKTIDDAARVAGRASADVRTMISAPPYVITNESERKHAHSQLNWFAGSVANHVADMVNAHGADGLPPQLTDYIKGRPTYDYDYHGKPNNPLTDYIPSEINERFCVIGTVDDHIKKLKHLESLGVDVFTGYFIHDNIDETMKAYGEHIIPQFK